ncbi:MAG: hypothetical protein DWQ36_24740 [Acidobacteria bacterium]|nr:MAG: hypothetical protein DWQ30_10780 [Acidobacteriota bacterium]REJ99547.1 MAG: hypothetical protein DWQ36_24740 [Acidobacteriota bacterium]
MSPSTALRAFGLDRESEPVDPGLCTSCPIDDGTVELGIGFNPNPPRVGIVERFDGERFKERTAVFCTCFLMAPAFPPLTRDLDFTVVFYADQGGLPGSLLASVEARIEEVPVLLPGKTVSVDLSGVTHLLPDEGPLFAGVEWNASTALEPFAVCIDGDSSEHGGFSFVVSGEWRRVDDIFPGYGRFFFRLEPEASVTAIPTVGGVGASVLVLALAGLALVRLRRS